MVTVHNNANKGDFAKVVIMPGDPLRAKWIADTFLKDAKLVNSVRGISGYTGFTQNGKRISVMASGMGMPSIGIYSHELFFYYGVEVIIRVGTAGSYSKKAGLGSIVLCEGACHDANALGNQFLAGGCYSAIADFELLKRTYEVASDKKLPVNVGNVLSSDIFYSPIPDDWKKWANLGILAVEMETYALYTNAAALGKKALTILTISDSFVEEGKLSSDDRQSGLVTMIDLAIEACEPYLD